VSSVETLNAAPVVPRRRSPGSSSSGAVELRVVGFVIEDKMLRAGTDPANPTEARSGGEAELLPFD
jgi:hypothetical protein